MQTRSGQVLGASPVKTNLKDKVHCPSCKTPLDQPRTHNPGHAPGLSSLKIILNVKVSCPVCKAAFDQLLSCKTWATCWTKKKIQKWAEASPSVTVNRIVLRQKKYVVKFHRGTTLKLRNGDKVSILRIPNRWTWEN